MSRKYVILDASEVAGVNFDLVLETSLDTLRYNVAGDKTVLKYEGETPSFLIGKSLLSHSEIREILSGPEWNAPVIEDL